MEELTKEEITFLIYRAESSMAKYKAKARMYKERKMFESAKHREILFSKWESIHKKLNKQLDNL